MDLEMLRSFASEKGFELVETHISWVLIGTDSVYKIKKPVKFSFLDFSTPARRRFFCGEEVRLNRRLTDGIYLGVVRFAQAKGRIRILDESGPSEGEEIEYAVKMRKLDRTKMMDKLLREGNVREQDILALAQKVAEFHMKAERAKEEYGSIAMIWDQIADLGNFKETIQKAIRMGAAVEFVLGRSKAFIDKNQSLLEKRARDGKVKDCHGDLHSGNIFLDHEIVITDCIEFSRDFRCIDVASDVAFMAMDLDYAGRTDLSRAFVQEYLAKTKDSGMEMLIDFYKCYRANVRAKIAAIEWTQNPSKEREERMRSYLALAERYAMRW
jgi:aminoglycoside phosphotransferase family enzyme